MLSPTAECLPQQGLWKEGEGATAADLLLGHTAAAVHASDSANLSGFAVSDPLPAVSPTSRAAPGLDSDAGPASPNSRSAGKQRQPADSGVAAAAPALAANEAEPHDQAAAEVQPGKTPAAAAEAAALPISAPPAPAQPGGQQALGAGPAGLPGRSHPPEGEVIAQALQGQQWQVALGAGPAAQAAPQLGTSAGPIPTEVRGSHAAQAAAAIAVPPSLGQGAAQPPQLPAAVGQGGHVPAPLAAAVVQQLQLAAQQQAQQMQPAAQQPAKRRKKQGPKQQVPGPQLVQWEMAMLGGVMPQLAAAAAAQQQQAVGPPVAPQQQQQQQQPRPGFNHAAMLEQSLAYHQLWGATPDAAALAGAMQQAGLNPYAALQQPFWPPVSAAAGGALPAGQLGWQQLAQGAAAAQQLAQGATAAQQLPAGMQYGLPGNMHHEQAGLLRQQGPSGQDYAALLQASAAQAVAAAAQQAQGGTGAPAPRRKPPPPPPATTAVQAPPEQLLQPPQPSGQRGVGEAPVQPLQQEPRAEPGANFSRQQQEQEPGAPAAATAPAGVQGEQGGMKPEPQGQQQVGPSAPAWDGEAAELQSPSVDEAMLAASALKALQGDGGFLGGSGLVGPAGPAPLPPRPPQQGGGGGGAEGSAGRRRKAAPTKLSWQGQPAGGDGSDGGQASDGEWVPSWAPSVGSSRGRGRGRGRGGRGRGRGFAAAAAYSREGSRSEGSPIEGVRPEVGAALAMLANMRGSRRSFTVDREGNFVKTLLAREVEECKNIKIPDVYRTMLVGGSDHAVFLHAASGQQWQLPTDPIKLKWWVPEFGLQVGDELVLRSALDDPSQPLTHLPDGSPIVLMEVRRGGAALQPLPPSEQLRLAARSAAGSMQGEVAAGPAAPAVPRATRPRAAAARRERPFTDSEDSLGAAAEEELAAWQEEAGSSGEEGSYLWDDEDDDPDWRRPSRRARAASRGEGGGGAGAGAPRIVAVPGGPLARAVEPSLDPAAAEKARAMLARYARAQQAGQQQQASGPADSQPEQEGREWRYVTDTRDASIPVALRLMFAPTGHKRVEVRVRTRSEDAAAQQTPSGPSVAQQAQQQGEEVKQPPPPEQPVSVKQEPVEQQPQATPGAAAPPPGGLVHAAAAAAAGGQEPGLLPEQPQQAWQVAPTAVPLAVATTSAPATDLLAAKSALADIEGLLEACAVAPALRAAFGSAFLGAFDDAMRETVAGGILAAAEVGDAERVREWVQLSLEEA